MKKKSKYKPKQIRLDTMEFVKQGIVKVADVPVAGIKLRLQSYEAFDTIVSGEPTKDHVDTLISCGNMAETLARFGHGQDWLPEIMQAQKCILEMGRRGLKKGSFRFTGDEMQKIRLLLEIHDAQLEVTTVRDMEKALDYIAKQIMAGRATPVEETK